MAHLVRFVLLLLFIGCGDDDAVTPGMDAGPRTDAGPGVDGGPTPGDSGPGLDAGPTDAGPPPDAGPPVDPLEGIGDVELVDEGYVFTEGPQWIEEDGVLLFTDIPANTIYRLRPSAGDAVDVFRSPSDNANGLAVDPMGRLLAAEHGARRVSRTELDGEVVAVCEEYMLDRFNSPNDLIVRSDGTVYFTDPPYGLPSAGARELPYNGIFRATPADQCHVEEMRALAARPNGIVLSPDESVLYVADTEGCNVAAFDVAGDGTLSGEREFATGVCGADGIAVDTAGNLWVTNAAGITVFAPDGTEWGNVTVPRTPANAAFGDADARTLYITARQGLYRVRVVVPGIY